MAIFGAMFSYCLTPVKDITSLKIGSSHFRVTSTDSKSLNHLEQHNKQHYRKVLLSSFHLDGHTHRISSTDSKVRTTLCSIINSTIGKYCSVAFIWMVTLRILSTDSKVRITLYIIINSTTAKYGSIASI